MKTIPQCSIGDVRMLLVTGKITKRKKIVASFVYKIDEIPAFFQTWETGVQSKLAHAYYFLQLWTDQLRYIKIQPKTINLSTRLWGITTEIVEIACNLNFLITIDLRPHLYGLGYPRQPSPRVTVVEATFSLFLSKLQPATVYIRKGNLPLGVDTTRVGELSHLGR